MNTARVGKSERKYTIRKEDFMEERNVCTVGWQLQMSCGEKCWFALLLDVHQT
jgi:hypothetical protein